MTAVQATLFDLPAADTAGRPGHRPPVRATRRTAAPAVAAQPAASPTHNPPGGQLAAGLKPPQWTFTLLAPVQMMSVNTSKHWRVTSPAKKAWRKAMFDAVTKAKLPTGLARVRVDIELRFPTGGTRDESNYHHYVAKPIVDALGRGRRYQIKKGRQAGTWVDEPGYQLIADDNPKRYLHCRQCPHLFIADVKGPRPYGEVVVTITDLSPNGGTS